MRTIKVKSIYKGFNRSMNEVLPFGFETCLDVKTRDDDRIRTVYSRLKDGTLTKKEETIWRKGDFENYTFLGANGQKYDSSFIMASVGYKSLDKIFKKLKE